MLVALLNVQEYSHTVKIRSESGWPPKRSEAGAKTWIGTTLQILVSSHFECSGHVSSHFEKISLWARSQHREDAVCKKPHQNTDYQNFTSGHFQHSGHVGMLVAILKTSSWARSQCREKKILSKCGTSNFGQRVSLQLSRTSVLFLPVLCRFPTVFPL